MARNHDAQRVAADRAADVSRVRPRPQAPGEIAVGGRLPVRHLGDELPYIAVEFRSLDGHGQLECAAVPGEVLLDLARDILKPANDAGPERGPVGPGPMPLEVQPRKSPFPPNDRQL